MSFSEEDREEQTLPPTTPEPVIAPPQRRRRKAWYKTTRGALLVLLAAVGVFIAVYFGTRGAQAPQFRPALLTSNMPRRSCMHVDDRTIFNNREDTRWLHTVQSMRYYIENDNLEGISAFHLGEADCFIMLRMPDNTTLSMYNARFTGYDTKAISVRNEQSMACPTISRTMKRSDVIIASYTDAKTANTMLIRLEGQTAWAFQHVNAYSMGKTICDLHAENTDKEVEGLRAYIEKIN